MPSVFDAIRRRGRRLAVATAVGLAIIVFGGIAGAMGVQTATLTMTSDPGDFVGAGQSYTYSTPGSLFETQLSGAGVREEIRVLVRTPPSGTEFWFVDLAAPRGEELAVGTYTGAVRTVSRQGGQPGLDVSGQGRGCNALTGEFTVFDVVFGPFEYVESLHATFEQHCEGVEPALRGEITLSNPPPPPFSVEVAFDPDGQLTSAGSATLTGTIICNGQVDPNRSVVELSASQTTKKGVVAGTGAFQVPAGCSSTPVAWTARLNPVDRRFPFTKGDATVSAHARVFDTFYGAFVEEDAEGSVSLKEG